MQSEARIADGQREQGKLALRVSADTFSRTAGTLRHMYVQFIHARASCTIRMCISTCIMRHADSGGREDNLPTDRCELYTYNWLAMPRSEEHCIGLAS